MSNSVKKEKHRLVIDIIIVSFIAVILIFVILILTSGKETTVHSDLEVDNNSAVVCKNNTDDGSFFNYSYSRKSVSHEIRALLINSKLSSIFLIYTGVYDSDIGAERASGIMHGDLNDFLSGYRIAASSFAPKFTVSNNTLVIELYSGMEAINSVSSKLFYIGSDEFDKVKSFNASKIKKMYEDKGFSCVIEE